MNAFITASVARQHEAAIAESLDALNSVQMLRNEINIACARVDVIVAPLRTRYIPSSAHDLVAALPSDRLRPQWVL